MFGDLPRYNDRVPTGQRSMPDAPANWSVTPMRAVVRSRSERNRADLPLLTVARERGVFVRRDSDDNHNAIPEDLSTYKVARAGDLVVNKMKAWQGSLGLAPVDGIVSPAYYVFDFNISDRHFGQYLLRSKPYVALMAAASDGVRIGQWDLVMQRFRELPVLVPPPSEQAAIARYLAHAHARIDRAIAAQRKLIDLLDEERRADLHRRLIEEPVGELVPVKSLLRPVRSLVGASHHGKTLLSLTLRGVIARDMENAKGKFPADFSTYQSVVPGQFVFCLFDVDETPRTIGLSDLDGMITGAYDAFDALDPSASEYLELFFTAMDDAKAYRPLYSGLRKVLPRDRFLRTRVPLPPEPVRRAIVDAIRDSRARSEGAAARAAREIELLREFRTRLTADVVTGQVDVRAVAAALPDVHPDQVVEVGAADEDDSYGEELLAADDEID